MRLTHHVTLVVFLALTPAIFADLLPTATPIPQAVDHYIDLVLNDQGITPAPAADDAAFLRRVTLDLVGRIPTRAELSDYLAATSPDKREKLIDRLMASPGFARHQAAEFDAILMAGTGGNLREFLTAAFAENRAWDQLFRELLLPAQDQPTDPKAKDKSKVGGAGAFLMTRLKDLDRLTNDVSVAFFGVNVSCAQCHDHPLVADWKQDHFFGMKSFFSRTFEVGGFLAERDYGQVKFKTTAGQDKQARFMFLTGMEADVPAGKEPNGEEQRKEKERIEQAKKDKKPLPPPSVSARAKLVELALQPGQRDFFARAVVNRLWYRFFGHGLVMPLDQMHSENPASHPELLNWLARDLIDHGYDLKRLTRGLLLSRAYGRSSLWQTDSDPPPAKLFAVTKVRPLTPDQLGASLKVATADPAHWANGKPEELEQRAEGLAQAGRGLAGLFERPGENFQVSATEALLFSNADRLNRELLNDAGLIRKLMDTSDRAELITLAMQATLSRKPTADEMAILSEFLAKRADRPVDGCKHLVWALLTCSEFRFNH